MMIRPEEVLRIEDLTISQNQNDDSARDNALRNELEGIQNLNLVMEGVINAMTKAKENMDAVGTTVENADRLLDIWIKVLSQAEHTQRLLLDGKWQGSTEDARAQEERLRQEEAAAALAASQAAEQARQKAAEAAEKAKLDAARTSAGKTPTRGRGILKNTTSTTSTRGGMTRGTAVSQTASMRGRGVVRGTRGTTTTGGTTRGSSIRGRGSLVK